MTNSLNAKQNCQKCYQYYYQFREVFVLPWLLELWYLRIPAFVAVLSFVLFAFVDQTLEIYRILTQEPWEYLFSFLFLLFLALFIWYSGWTLSIEKQVEVIEKLNREEKREFKELLTEWTLNKVKKSLENFLLNDIPEFLKNIKPAILYLLRDQNLDNQRRSISNSRLVTSKVKALIWLPRILGSFPLTACFIGLFRAIGWNTYQILLPISGLIVYCIVVIFRIKREKQLEKNEQVKRIETFEKITFVSSIIAFFLFTLPMATNQWMRGIFFGVALFASIYVFWVRDISCNTGNIKIIYNNSDNPIKITLLFLLTIFLVVIWFYTSSEEFLILPSKFSFLQHPISVIAIFLNGFVFFVSSIYHWGYRKKIPMIGILLSLAIISSLLNWNDNHQIRQLSTSSENQETSSITKKTEKASHKMGAIASRLLDSNDNYQTEKISNFSQKQEEFPTLTEAFKQWWNNPERITERQNRDESNPYPIYIVSAQGGGIFAAYHAALTLSRLQDVSPNFAEHVFAISGVSGGSLGATAFSSLVKSEIDEIEPEKIDEIEPRKLEDKAHKLLDRDFLSPLLGVGLFPDLAQRFIPFPIDDFDRARALEYAFEQSWKEEIEEDFNPLKDSFYKHWNPANASPALVLNTTVVETGDRLVLSPFKVDLPTLKDIRTVACKKDEKDIDFPLSTAAVLSARFPVVTPVGGFKKCNGNPTKPIKSRLADGGYFENSGFSTAWEIGQKIEKILDEEQNQEYKIVYLAITNNDYIEPERATVLNELWSPISALWKTRDARSRNVIHQAEEQIDGDIKDNSDLKKHRFRQFYLTHVDGSTPVKTSSGANSNSDKLPLGWYLSKTSQEVIKDRIGDYSKCSPGKENNNHCVMKSIVEELS